MNISFENQVALVTGAGSMGVVGAGFVASGTAFALHKLGVDQMLIGQLFEHVKPG
jgi:hypothetical protein